MHTTLNEDSRMRRSTRLLTCLVLGAWCAAVLPHAARAQSAPPTATTAPIQPQSLKTDVIRGRVTSDSGHAVAGATVVVTVAPTTNTVLGETDSSGTYRVEIPDGTGEYVLFISHAGFKPFHQRVTRPAAAGDIIVNATLATDVQLLAAVQVKATRSRPQQPNSSSGFGTSGVDKTIDGVSGALSPDLAGNLDAMAALVPGITMTPDGPSVLGLGAGANSTQLNGMSFPGGSLPPDATTTTRFVTSPWDPSYGGAAGFLRSVTLASGGNVSTRRGSVSLDAPQLQASDAIGRAFGTTFSGLQLGTGGDGALVLDKYFYNYGAQVFRRVSTSASLLDLNPAALQASGISPDSAQRLIQVLEAAGIPLAGGGIASTAATTAASFVGRIDRSVPVPRGLTPNPHLFLTGYGQVARSDAVSLNPIAPPALGGRRTNVVASLQGDYTRYLGKLGDYVNETTSALSFTSNQGTPYVNLPGGNALITSNLGPAGVSLGSIGFGGNTGLASRTKAESWEVVNQTGFLLRGLLSLPMKLYLQSRIDGFQQDPGQRLGTFSYASIADVANGQPSSFSRTLNIPSTSGGEWVGAAAFGGTWTRRNTFQLQGGARVDGNVFLRVPDLNPQIQSLFGARTDRAPNSVGVSPRLGFEWYYKAGGRSLSMSGGQLSRLYRGGPEIRGGIGRFRGTPSAQDISGAMAATGLPGALQPLLCVGAAAPTPDWSAFASDPASVPTSCAGGAPSLADTARSAQLFDRDYRPLSSWRGTLGWTNTIKNTYLTIDGTYSLAVNSPGTTDLNFAGVRDLTLVTENNRPVFVPAGSIVPSTGLVSPAAARTSAAFGRITDRVSDLRARAGQVTVYAVPNIPFRFGIITLGYTYAAGRTQTRGFDLTTAGDPRLVEWGPTSNLPHHQVSIQAAHIFGNFGITTFVHASSGVPFTPLVAGDINGDGLSFNDRAFVFDPTTPGSPVSAALQSLMATGPAAARKCLFSQVNHIAAPNSCMGPWSASMTSSIYIFPSLPHIGQRAQLSLSLSNPLGGVDMLLHGANDLRGWGSQPFPDQTLYRVRGFNASTNTFVYEVNPRFGSSSPSTTGIRNPFRVSLSLTMELGHSTEAQRLELTLREKPALKGTRAPADTIKQRYMNSTGTTAGYMDIYRLLLGRFADSLALSRDQMEQLEKEDVALTAKADSIYGQLATYLAALPANYDEKAAVDRAKAATDSLWAAIYAEKPFLLRVLTPGQIRRLPTPLLQMVTVPNYRGRFFYSF